MYKFVSFIVISWLFITHFISQDVSLCFQCEMLAISVVRYRIGFRYKLRQAYTGGRRCAPTYRPRNNDVMFLGIRRRAQ